MGNHIHKPHLHLPHLGKKKKSFSDDLPLEENLKITEVYETLTKGKEGKIDYWIFQEKFGTLLASSLWKYLQQDAGNEQISRDISLEEFTEYADSLMGTGTMNNDSFVELLMPVENLLRTSLECNNVEVRKEDEPFLDMVASAMIKDGGDLNFVLEWVNTNCPRICEPVKGKIRDIFAHVHDKNPHQVKMVESKILSPVQMFFLQHCLPLITYFLPKREHRFELMTLDEQGKSREPLWNRIFWKDSDDKIDIENFEASVMDYYGATTTIFKLTDEVIYALSIDDEWKLNGTKFGGPHTILFQLHPIFKRFDERPPAVYCNLKSIDKLKGLKVGQEFIVQPKMANVEQLEVWGCQGDKETLIEWHKKLTERPELLEPKREDAPKGHGRKPISNNEWQRKQDKQLLEMAGMEFSDSRGVRRDKPKEPEPKSEENE